MKRLLAVVVWLFVLGIFTCTGNLDALLYHQSVAFQWNSHPNFADLLITSDAHVTNPHWQMIKCGHFMGFAILELLLSRFLGNRKAAIVPAILFGIVTEILQLYFSRDGRVTDMVIDSAGAVLSYYGQMALHRLQQRADGL